MSKMKEISTEGLLLLMRSNPHCKIIDVRSVDAYNGWQTIGEVRGGHIQGAKSLPYKWTN